MKASNVTASRRLAKEHPDLEEAVEESDEADVLEDNSNEDIEDLDLSKDKYVKQPRKKSLPRKSSKPQKGKMHEDGFEENMQDDKAANEVKKGKGKGMAKSRRI